MDPVFLTIEQVLELHRMVLEEHGGSGGVRDLGLLDAAVSMPKAGFGGDYLHPDIPTMAAAYLYHLCKNHPFVDGNKRVAVTAAEVFLEENRLELLLTDSELETLTLRVANGEASKQEVVEALSHVRPR